MNKILKHFFDYKIDNENKIFTYNNISWKYNFDRIKLLSISPNKCFIAFDVYNNHSYELIIFNTNNQTIVLIINNGLSCKATLTNTHIFDYIVNICRIYDINNGNFICQFNTSYTLRSDSLCFEWIDTNLVTHKKFINKCFICKKMLLECFNELCYNHIKSPKFLDYNPKTNKLIIENYKLIHIISLNDSEFMDINNIKTFIITSEKHKIERWWNCYININNFVLSLKDDKVLYHNFDYDSHSYVIRITSDTVENYLINLDKCKIQVSLNQRYVKYWKNEKCFVIDSKTLKIIELVL